MGPKVKRTYTWVGVVLVVVGCLLANVSGQRYPVAPLAAIIVGACLLTAGLVGYVLAARD